MDRQPLHVIDLEAEIGLDQALTVHQRTRPDVAPGDSPDPHADAAQRLVPALQHQHVAGWQEGEIGDVVAVMPGEPEQAGLRAADKRAERRLCLLYTSRCV